ncbi:hypothetical protein L21SP2_2064 [Salinispira pacifica]|uniref:Uncharacterized protein n=1 Tax=Salinispira pacifica TaxID=1307761 RepID=V5WJS8_9SPIO|nr:hypothetical protein L21SP2_2064 [Salinispira pacifica]
MGCNPAPEPYTVVPWAYHPAGLLAERNQKCRLPKKLFSVAYRRDLTAGGI